MGDNTAITVETVLVRIKDMPLPPGLVAFGPRIQDGDLVGLGVMVPEGTWAELGKPNQITVTVEPGDRLN